MKISAQKILRMIERDKNVFILVILFLAAVLFFVFAFYSFFTGSSKTSENEIQEAQEIEEGFVDIKNATYYPEVDYLAQNQNFNFQDLSNYFTDLTEKKGAAYAYEVLKITPIPSNIDLHLMGHVVGDVLFKKQGIKGIEVCTHYFRNACSHSIVVGLFLERGTGALKDIAQACKKAPGGRGAYGMCFHGLGHGILAFTEYDFRKAIELCKELEKLNYDGSEYPQCAGGAVMEMVAGVHDRVAWEKQRENYIPDNDPLAPCSLDFMEEQTLSFCYAYLTPRLFRAAGMQLNNPDPSTFKKAFSFCEDIEGKDLRDRCYSSFGKEFLGFVIEKDIRGSSIEKLTKGEFLQVYSWCLIAEYSEGIKHCLLSVLSNLYWGGENKRGPSILFCKTIPDDQYQESCFTILISMVAYFIDDDQYMIDFCSEIPGKYKQECAQSFHR